MTAGSDGSLSLWKPAGLRLKRYDGGHTADALTCAASKDNARLGSGGADKAVVLWDVSSGKSLRKFRGHVGASISHSRSRLRSHSFWG